MANERERMIALLSRSAALHRAMVLDLPQLLEDAGLSDEEHLCREAEALADEIDAALSPSPSESTDKGDAVEPSQERARNLLADECKGQSFVQRKLREDNYRQHNIMIPANIAIRAIERALAASSPRVDEDAIRAAAFEEAATVAEDLPSPYESDDPYIAHAHCQEAGAWSNGCDAAAAAIRALKGTPSPIDEGLNHED